MKKLQKWVDLKGKSVLVIGSELPWLETTCLYLGAAKVTTLEYGKIESLHPQIHTLTPEDFRMKVMNNTLELFDGILSHSSLEHPGLGRYGDALNPWADLLSVARSYCVTKDDGFLVLGLPTGNDTVFFNAHRMYGKVSMDDCKSCPPLSACLMFSFSLSSYDGHLLRLIGCRSTGKTTETGS